MDRVEKLLRRIVLWLVALVPWKRARQTQRRKLNHLPVRIFPQTFDYSCTASVLQSAIHSLTGIAIDHNEAVELMKCRPDGAHLTKIAAVVRKKCGAKTKEL